MKFQKIKRIPPGLLWFKIAEDYNCLSFSKCSSDKELFTRRYHIKNTLFKNTYSEPMVELYDLLSNSNVYKSNLYRWKARRLWARYSLHNRSMKIKKWWHWFVLFQGWTYLIYLIDRTKLLRTN